jgi:hypothetical protein
MSDHNQHVPGLLKFKDLLVLAHPQLSNWATSKTSARQECEAC